MNVKLLKFIVFSLLFHLIILSIPFDLFLNNFEYLLFSEAPSKPEMKITPISLKSFRTAGIKNGQKNNFIPDIKKSPIVNSIPKLSSNPTSKGNIQENKVAAKKEKAKKDGITFQNYSLSLQDTLANNNFPVDAIPQNSAINIRVETPEGVTLDELNPLELKFYIFNKRHFESFGLALYKSYNRFLQENPHVSFYNMGNQKSVAKVVFFPNGRIDEVKMLDAADDNKFQYFFQDTIENIMLPNPPTELLINGKFSVYYTLLLQN